MDELFENLIFEALKDKATDLHFKLDEKQLTISLRIYGELTFFKSFDRALGAKLMNYLKYRSMINVNYKMQPQTGAFHYELDHHTYFLRVSYLPGLRFESIVIRILNNHEDITIEKLSDIPTFTSFLENICEKRQGLFLVAGATGSGKSTSLYSILDRIIEEGGRNVAFNCIPPNFFNCIPPNTCRALFERIFDYTIAIGYTCNIWQKKKERLIPSFLFLSVFPFS